MPENQDVLAVMIKQLQDSTDEYRIENSAAHEKMIARLDKTNGRVNWLEKSIYFIYGVTAAIVALNLPAKIIDIISK